LTEREIFQENMKLFLLAFGLQVTVFTKKDGSTVQNFMKPKKGERFKFMSE